MKSREEREPFCRESVEMGKAKGVGVESGGRREERGVELKNRLGLRFSLSQLYISLLCLAAYYQ